MKWLKQMSSLLLAGSLLTGSLGVGTEVSAWEPTRLLPIHRSNIRRWKDGGHPSRGGAKWLENIPIGMSMWRKCSMQIPDWG